MSIMDPLDISVSALAVIGAEAAAAKMLGGMVHDVRKRRRKFYCLSMN